MSFDNITIIGFGEVGQALAGDFLAFGKKIHVYDLLLKDKNSKPSIAVKTMGVNAYASHAEAAQKGELIICAVTAAQTIAAAQEVAKAKLEGQYYLDLNSASPASKLAASQAIAPAGGRYIEASVMSPIHPKRIASPILLGGPYARGFAYIAPELGLSDAKFYADEWGKTAATKLCRSVMIKGLEALISESMLSAYYYGVQDEVLTSLNNLFPHPDWKNYAHYMIARTLEHGVRRAEEMREAAKTVQEAGIEPLMSLATAQRQEWGALFKEALKYKALDEQIGEIRSHLKLEEIQ